MIGRVITLILLVSSAAFASNDPRADLAAIRLPSDLKISLFAAEPDVVDPVALTFDEAGRMYVVEMRDYPYGIGPEKKPGGTIRLLEDTNGDGKADKSTVFAKDLSFPTSIAPWKGGVIVTAPPQILFLKDTDGDGVADVREVLFDGFHLGVTDSNVNGLRWGLDNRIHGANGGNGGTITSPSHPKMKVSITDSDFAFDPETGDFQATYQTGSGFGLVFDTWGRGFVTYNISHIQHRIMMLRYLNQNPGMLPVQATTSISDHEEMSRIYPISEPKTRENHPEQSGHFSAAGGLGYLGDSRWPSNLSGNVLVGDVVGNLIHRDVILPEGPIFKAARAPEEQQSEFIASKDSSARFIAFELGPDGALYIADMQRDVIEHPDYIPEKIRKKIDIRAGENRGRIYRVVPKADQQFKPVLLNKRSSRELLDQLGHPNQWVRMTAQRLLVEHKDPQTRKLLLEQRGKTNSPIAMTHWLWLAERFGIFSAQGPDFGDLLKEPSPGFQENLIAVTGRAMDRNSVPPGFQMRLAKKLKNERDQRLRFVGAVLLRNPDLVDVVDPDWKNYWTRIAVYAGLKQPYWRLVSAINRRESVRGQPEAPFLHLKELAELTVARDAQHLDLLFQKIIEWHLRDGLLEVMQGINAGLERLITKPNISAQSREALKKLAVKSDPLLFAEIWSISQKLKLEATPAQAAALSEAIEKVKDTTAPENERVAAMHLLRFGQYEQIKPAMLRVLEGPSSSELQKAALEVLKNFRTTETGAEVARNWRNFAPSLRTSVINFLLSHKNFHGALMDAIEKNEIGLGELNLDLEQRRILLRESSPEIKARAAKLIGDEEYSNRKSIVEEWLAKLPPSGEPLKGRAVFEKTCAQCHKLDGIGFNVGPDLSSVAHRSVEDIVSNILDPNMAINPSYVTYSAVLDDGEIESGILKSESPDSITLLQAEEKKITLPRAKVKKLQASGISLMPEGLEKGMTPQDLRDLVSFLQK